jgi:hypothetical protein
MKRSCTLTAVLLMALAIVGASQNQEQDFHPRVPTVTFDRVWQPISPQEFTISAKTDGPASYVSRNPLKPVAAGEEKEPDYALQFTMSSANQRKIFRLAEQANYFKGDFDFKAHRMADTGKKTLTYADETRHFQTVYNYSENKAIQELTNIFLGISNTIEHGRKLEFLHKYDKLGLESELKAMEDAASSHNLAEIQVITPTLKSIADDSAVLNIARQRAKRLLAKAEK